MGKIVKEGKRLRLRVAELKDLDYIMEAENRPENVRFILPESREVHEKGLNSESMVHFIVEEKDTGNAVGFLMIGNLNNPDHEVEWRKVIIDAKGRGYGHETMELLEEWSFEDMKFHRGWLDCKDYNERALHVYEAAGLQREALLRETMLVNGKYERGMIYECTAKKAFYYCS